MAKIRFEKEIEKCWDCPMCRSEQTLTADSFEVAFDYFCNLKDELIMGYVEHNWEMPPVPDWCPLLILDKA